MFADGCVQVVRSSTSSGELANARFSPVPSSSTMPFSGSSAVSAEAWYANRTRTM